MTLDIQKFRELIPTYVTNVAEELQKNNYEAYLVGGSVRDILLGRVPSDFDIATNAYPEEVEKIFPKSIPVGAKFGTIIVVTEDEKGERYDVEVTTYRSEADYFGGRWPSKIEFTKTIEEDLARRDFTINAVALDLQRFDELNIKLEDILIDPYGGIQDLESHIIKAVGNPIDRFTDDGLRAVRGCRLAAQLDGAIELKDENDKGFVIEENTFEAMKQTNHITKQVSVERFREELMKLLLKSPKPSKGLRLMKEAGILQLFIPELLEGIEVNQPQFHVDDVFEHSLKTVDYAEDSIKLAALFHDIGKPRTRSEDERGIHFYGHDIKGAEMVREIMKRLKFPNTEIDRTANLVRWHMFYYPSADWRKEKTIPEHLELGSSDSHGWTDAGIRRFIQNVGGEDVVDDLMKLRIADATANPKTDFHPRELDALAERISAVRAKDMVLRVEDLDISGHDLMQELNIQPGKELGDILQFLLDKVIEEPLLNKKEELLKLAREYKN